MSNIVREENLSSLNLSLYSKIHLIIRPEDDEGLVKLEWPIPEGEEKSELRVLAQNAEEENLHLLAAKVASIRKEQIS